ncbi:MAG: ArnT family glycosyltransferase [Pseudobdellovibrionaceae bacterium]
MKGAPVLAEFQKRSNTLQKVFIFFTLSILFRILFISLVGLADDEAYHWSWTKNLSLSYYDHPAMIAWLEALTTSLFGDTRWGIRLPSFLCYLATAALGWKLAREVFGVWAANFTLFLMLWSPLWGFGGYVASPETPFMLCWVAGAYIFWQGIREDEKKWSVKKTWLSLGLIMGLGLNSKFIMALLAPGFGLYLLMTPKHRKDLLSKWPWMGIFLATLICLPIFIWNLHYDWPGFKYQFHERHTTAEFSVSRWLQFFSAQILFYTPVAYALMLFSFGYALFHLLETRWRWLFCLTVPSILLFYPQPLWAEYKPHWSGPAFFLLAMGAGALWSEGISFYGKVRVKAFNKKITWGILGFIIALNLAIYLPFVYPWLPKVHRALNPSSEWQSKWDLSNEFTGWLELGDYVNRRQREIHAESGKRPFIASHRYETTAQTYFGTKQKVYMLSKTKSQYTVTQTPQEMEALRGSTALFVTTDKYTTNPMDWALFDTCTPEELKTYRHDEVARIFTVWICTNFQGIK